MDIDCLKEMNEQHCRKWGHSVKGVGEVTWVLKTSRCGPSQCMRELLLYGSECANREPACFNLFSISSLAPLSQSLNNHKHTPAIDTFVHMHSKQYNE